MATAAKAAARQTPGFRLGRKQVFLPDHVVTFVRKDHLPPNEACFNVPLRWTKFDLRDYLWNLYGVEVTAVRGYVKEQPLTQRIGLPNSWYRPQALKYMTVELAQPFQWPAVPDNLQPWNKDMWDRRSVVQEQNQKDNYNHQKGEIPLPSKQDVGRERKELRALARKMLKGEVKWQNDVKLDPKWDAILAESQAKTGVKPEVNKEIEEELTEKAINAGLAKAKTDDTPTRRE